MPTTIELESRLPVLTTEADMRAHCAAFGLTLLSWEKRAHELSVTVAETVTDAQQQQIAAAMAQQLAGSLVTVKPKTP